MKRCVSILCIVLILAMLATSAVAEPGYEFVSFAMEKSCGEGITLPGSALGDAVTTADGLFGKKSLVLLFDVVSKSIILIGDNENDSKECTVWSVEDETDVLARFYAYCTMWDTLETLLGDGYKLAIALNIEDDSIAIISAADAERVVEKFDELLGR